MSLDDAHAPSAIVEPIAGTTLSRVTLKAKAAKRIDAGLSLVHEDNAVPAGSTTRKRVVPYASVLYDTNNTAWVYTSPEPLVFVRHPIVIDHIQGDRAVLSDGPPAGTPVVTAGAAALFGTELGAARH